MAYNPYDDVKSIYNYKNDYSIAEKAGDVSAKNKAKESAQKNYESLINNGYADIADNLSKNNYDGSKAINDYYAMLGKTPANSYLGSLGSQYGLSQSWIDSQIKINPTTGEMTFGGKNVGTPYSVVNGTSYWDEAALDNMFNGLVSTSGLSKSLNNNDLYNQYIQRMDNTNGVMNDIYAKNGDFFNQYNQYFDNTRGKADDIFSMIAGNNQSSSQSVSDRTDQMWNTMMGDKSDLTDRYTRLENFNYSNPFETDTGKSVLQRYDLAALQGRDNQAATGGADNGGNIDSYSAANALRQQAALRSLGEQSALAAHTNTVDNGRGILGDLSGYYGGLYNNMTNAINAEANAASTRNQDLIKLLTDGYMTQDQQFFNNTQSSMGNYLDLLKNGYMTQDQQFFDNGQTSLNNQHSREQDALNQAMSRYGMQADITGQIPIELRQRDNPYLNSDGTLINPNIDYQAIINDLNTKINNTTDPYERAMYQSQIAQANDARSVKQKDANVSNLYGQNWVSTYAPTNANTQLAANQVNMAKQFALNEKELDANINYNNAALDWNKELGRLEMDYKNKGLTQEAANFALGIERDRYVAELNTSVGMDANNVQREITASNERVANIQAAANNYSTDQNTKLALAELAQKEQQFQSQLKETGRQFDAANSTQGGNSNSLDFGDTHANESWNKLLQREKGGFRITDNYVEKLMNELVELGVDESIIEEFGEQATYKFSLN